MDNLERYLDRVCRGLGGSASLRRHLRQELREHIQEAAERHREDGLPADEALEKAIADFGDPVAVHEGFEDVYGRDVIGLLIEKAMQWKENTMKAKWLWSGAASLLLLIVIFAHVFFPFCAMWLILPRMKEMLKDVGQDLPGFAVRFWGLANFLTFQYGWLWICVPLLILWAVFEWRYRGENRSLIRLSALAFISLVTTALMWWAAVAIVLPLMNIPAAHYAERPEQVVLENARIAEEAMTQLDRAVKAEEWQTAVRAAGKFRAAFEYGYIRESTAAGLLAMNQLQRLDEIRNELRKLTVLAGRVQSDPVGQLPEINRQMQEAFARLKTLAGGWPEAPQIRSASQPAATQPDGPR